MSNIFPFITLKSIPNGWKWNGKLKEFIKLKTFPSLKKINDNKIEEIAYFLNGAVLNSKLFRSLSWVLYFNPIPSLGIYLFCERNQKKGDDFRIMFSKDAVNVPAQEVYGFSLIYLTLLASIGSGKINFLDLNCSDSFINFEDIVKDSQTYKNLIYKKYSKMNLDFPKLTANINKYPLINDFIIGKDKAEIIVQPIKNILLKFNIQSNKEIKLYINKDAISKYPKNVIISFAGLLFSSFEREFSIKL